MQIITIYSFLCIRKTKGIKNYSSQGQDIWKWTFSHRVNKGVNWSDLSGKYLGNIFFMPNTSTLGKFSSTKAKKNELRYIHSLFKKHLKKGCL